MIYLQIMVDLDGKSDIALQAVGEGSKQEMEVVSALREIIDVAITSNHNRK